MRLGTIRHEGGTSAALVTDNTAAPVRSLGGRENATDVRALITRPLSTGEQAALRDHALPLEHVAWLPPLRPPKNVFCVGKNYLEHVKEGAKAEGLATAEPPTHPIWFSKAHTALTGHNHPIIADPTFTEQLDYEGELAVVIGARAQRVSPDNALQCVYGYTIVNDVTARDIQQQRKQWFLGKSADTFAPCGPWIVTADEVPDPQSLAITSEVNGQLRQQGSTKEMIFPVATLISDLSQAITLEPGDLIATGTPQGVAWGMDTPEFLTPGDSVTVTIERIGALTNIVATAPAVGYDRGPSVDHTSCA